MRIVLITLTKETEKSVAVFFVIIKFDAVPSEFKCHTESN